MNFFRKIGIFSLGIVVGALSFVVIQGLKDYSVVYQTVGFDMNALVDSMQDSLGGVTRNDYFQFDEVYEVLEATYYDEDKVNSGAMRLGALKSFVNAVEDPYTVYLDAVENEELFDSLKGSEDFEGIGAIVAKKDDGVLIQELIKGAPAFLAGLKPLDLIVKVGDESVANLSLAEAVELIRGPKDSEVLLTIIRTDKNNDRSIKEVTVIRDSIVFPSVQSDVIAQGDKKIGHISLYTIGEETENLLRSEIRVLKEANIDSLIIDLRGNGGGLLSTSVSVVSHFVPNGELVLEARYRSLSDEKFYSRGYMDFGEIPVVVLVDGLTASAGEIIALALSELIGAKIVGTTTFGKGTIQTIKEFEDTSSLKYTIGERFSPSGVNVHETGVEPDVMIEFDADLYEKDGTDNQLQKAIEILQ